MRCARPVSLLGVGLFFAVLLIFSVSEASKGNAQKPNIIFVLADDYGFNDIGYHGSQIRTPTLDELAGQGVKLENYYVQPRCSPTRSQLISGRYQIHTGLQHAILWRWQRAALPRNRSVKLCQRGLLREYSSLSLSLYFTCALFFVNHAHSQKGALSCR